MKRIHKTCATADCANLAAHKRTVCNTCRTRKRRAQYPLKAAYAQLKASAKRRGKVFSLTLEQFTEFAIKTEYVNKRSGTATGYTIDRIDQNRGYEIDNIQILTRSQNSRKYHIDRQYDPQQRQMHFRYKSLKREPTTKPADCPF